jgi:hypothetical protein
MGDLSASAEGKWWRRWGLIIFFVSEREYNWKRCIIFARTFWIIRRRTLCCEKFWECPSTCPAFTF